ncbi:site-2 protease family protein [Clostridium algidicarnis]|uniref:site-2 protease family protein n=1 Tax=Clostridium algidicarnis TaxID=37659 RepID=UPI001C0AFFC9|nr:site-2 protease family protein [Clostridium algidicarnis]MBU3228118.1 M50 family metallopeptidase [Clostridium algidicarnis]MBU3252002.1 M50 family metallopeptidase [Clostridium algidicarnis]
MGNFNIETWRTGVSLISTFLMIPMLLITILFHEIAHAIVARNYNVNVPEIGFKIYYFIPLAYTNLTFIALLDSKKQRNITLFAGCFMNFLLAGISFILACFFKGNLCVFCIAYGVENIILILTNMTIFFKLDGYYIYQELMEEKNLREKSMVYFKSTVIAKLTKLYKQSKDKVNIEIITLSTNNNIFYFLFGAICYMY